MTRLTQNDVPRLLKQIAELGDKLTEAKQTASAAVEAAETAIARAEKAEAARAVADDHAATLSVDLDLAREKVRSFEGSIDGAFAARDKARDGERAAKRAEEETRAQFADLKERLHSAELQIARYEGYLDRVAEDDAAADDGRDLPPMPQVEPRRPRAAYRGRTGGGSAIYGHDTERFATGMAAARPKHWTGY